mmetsp:Transcript_43962/g.138778  ORF Transcript_43962/g.138778 Transcript_43962/m.138778 type:complete len:283 (-) Transcript_43962:705-1553(-)
MAHSRATRLRRYHGLLLLCHQLSDRSRRQGQHCGLRAHRVLLRTLLADGDAGHRSRWVGPHDPVKEERRLGFHVQLNGSNSGIHPQLHHLHGSQQQGVQQRVRAAGDGLPAPGGRAHHTGRVYGVLGMGVPCHHPLRVAVQTREIVCRKNPCFGRPRGLLAAEQWRGGAGRGGDGRQRDLHGHVEGSQTASSEEAWIRPAPVQSCLCCSRCSDWPEAAGEGGEEGDDGAAGRCRYAHRSLPTCCCLQVHLRPSPTRSVHESVSLPSCDQRCLRRDPLEHPSS